MDRGQLITLRKTRANYKKQWCSDEHFNLQERDDQDIEIPQDSKNVANCDEEENKKIARKEEGNKKDQHDGI